MSTTTHVTADELLSLSSRGRYELIAGELRSKPFLHWRQGAFVGRILALIASHVRLHNLGKVFGAETGFRLARDPDTVRAPDVAFISRQQIPAEPPAEAYWPGAPDLAVEVLSPDDRKSEVDEKIAAWLAAGSSAVWVADPRKQTVAIHRPDADAVVLSEGDTLTGEPVLPGFTCRVSEIFGL